MLENSTKGVITMSERYRYWSVEIVERICKITLRVSDNLEDEITKTNSLLKKIGDERTQAKKARDGANGQERTELGYQYYAKDSKYTEVKFELAKLEEHYTVQRRNKGLEINVQRLKDKYSRKESVSVILVINGIEEAKVISTSTKIKEDIYKLEEYGVFLTAPYYDELAGIIRDIYFDMEVKETEFIENDIPTETVKAIVEMCGVIISECEEEERVGFLDKEGVYYNIPVKTFKQWYENSAFRKFSLTSIKEALIIHGYARGNKGRNEHTVAGVGKVVSLKKSELEKVGEGKKDEK